jgi:hypothetical protein
MVLGLDAPYLTHAQHDGVRSDRQRRQETESGFHGLPRFLEPHRADSKRWRLDPGDCLTTV